TFLNPLISLPLALLAHKKIETEWRAFGPLSREEPLPYGPTAVEISLKESSQPVIGRELVNKLSSLLATQGLAIGKRDPMLEEQLPFLLEKSEQESFFPYQIANQPEGLS